MSTPAGYEKARFPNGDRALTSGVRKGGLEPPLLAELDPKSSASTNSATFAHEML